MLWMKPFLMKLAIFTNIQVPLCNSTQMDILQSSKTEKEEEGRDGSF